MTAARISAAIKSPTRNLPDSVSWTLAAHPVELRERELIEYLAPIEVDGKRAWITVSYVQSRAA